MVRCGEDEVEAMSRWCWSGAVGEWEGLWSFLRSRGCSDDTIRIATKSFVVCQF